MGLLVAAGEQAAATTQSGHCSPMGTVGALNPAGSECARADWAVKDLLFLRSGHKMPLSLLGSVSSSDLRVKGEGRQGKGLLPSCSRPLTHLGGQKGSVSPSLKPAQGWAQCGLCPQGQGAIWGCPRATGARGRGRRAFRDAGLAGWGGVLKEQSPLGAAGLEGRAQPSCCPGESVKFSPTCHHSLLGTHQPAREVRHTAGKGSWARRTLTLLQRPPRERAGLLQRSPERALRATLPILSGSRGELPCSKSCSHFPAVAKCTASVTVPLLSSPSWNCPLPLQRPRL